MRADGVFAIARGVAPDRVISTVDPEARHGHKTSAHGFDGYKAHIAIDPDSEIITATAVTPANAPDGSVAEELLADVLAPADPAGPAPTEPTAEGDEPQRAEVYGDAAYGTADVVERLEKAGVEPNVGASPHPTGCKVQGASPPHKGMYSQDDFSVDTKAETVCCPQGVIVPLRRRVDGSGIAKFAAHCTNCPVRARCTTSTDGRQIHVHPQHDTLVRHRRRQKDPAWKQRYRSTRPKVERKQAHTTRRRHGGRRGRMRGSTRNRHDHALLAAAVNLHRLAVLGVRHTELGWSR